MDDRLLAELLATRDPQALEALMDRYMRDVYAVAARILAGAPPPSDVEEAASEAFIAAWEAADRYDPARAPLRTWLLMHAKYAALSQRRRAARWVRPRPTAQEAAVQSAFESLAAQEEREQVHAALRSLAPLDREIVYRRYFLEEDIERLAQDLGLSRGAVDNRLTRARKVLRGLLAAEIAEEGGDADGSR